MRLSQFLEVDVNKYLDAIRDAVNLKDSRIQSLEEDNKALKDEHYKDKELKELRLELSRMREAYWRGFPISEEEKKTIEEWCEKHERDVHGLHTLKDRLKAGGSIGGRYHYVFLPTSIGVSAKIVCNCGEEFEFQEI